MKGRIKAEMWDRMQFLFRNFYDRMIHFKLCYDGRIDVDILKRVVTYMVDRAPVLHSSFHSSPIKPYWKVEDYTADDIVIYEQVDDLDKAAADFFAGCIPYDNNVQLKIAVFEHEGRSVLAYLVNHMCMDGGDFKYLIATLTSNYNALMAGDEAGLTMKSGPRNYEQVYSKFEGEDLKKARGLYRNISKNKDKVYFPWDKPSIEDKNIIIAREIDAERSALLRKVVKAHGMTINDAVMTITVRSLYELLGLDEHSPLNVSCAVDLRRYIACEGANCGLTNHTAWLACRTAERGDTIWDTAKQVTAIMQAHKKDKFMGLYSLPLLKLGYTIFPSCIAELAIKIGYDNPLLAVSNVGRIIGEHLELSGTRLTGGLLSGATKYKPYFLMSAMTVLDHMVFSTTLRGSRKDVEIVNKYFDILENNFDKFIQISL